MSEQFLDEAALDELKDILDSEFKVLVQTFVQDSGLRLQDIQAAQAAGDAEGLRKAAHSLKGASANLGLLVIAEHCNKLEEAARQGSVQGLEDIVVLLASDRERAILILQAKV